MLLLKRVLMAKLAEHGVVLELTTGGPTVRGIDQELVREEFYQQTPADGTERQKQDFRRKRLARTVNRAIEKRLIGMREIGGCHVPLAAPQSTQRRGRLLERSECSIPDGYRYNRWLADTSTTTKTEVSA